LEIDMSIESENRSSTLETLSAMADGEVDSTAAAQACAAWRDDSSARYAWHSYHLIGDVLRSEDLAIAQDASLLTTLRMRLANEPTILAPDKPRPQHTHRSPRWTWIAPSAVAAGFVLVAGALMVTRQSATGGDAAALTASTAFDRGTTRDGAFDSTLQPRSGAIDVKLLRDARLDRYLAAHQQFAGSTALGVPSGFLRNAAAEAPNR
jgi:sigma-E factor negative regulatory protein RseA